MARADYWQYLVDRQGNPLQYAEVRVYLAGTLTEANIFNHPELGSFNLSSDINLKTNKYGFVQFWIGDQWEVEGGYGENQLFKIVWQNTVDSIEESIDNLLVFSAVRPISLQNNSKNIDKVISNTQGKKWDDHVDSIVPSASPHDLEPVVLLDLDSTPNKVINNKIGYQMYTLANTASSTDVDASAARYYSEEISSWTTSGGKYYKDVTHSFNNYYPIVKVFKTSNYAEVRPMRVERISDIITRVWLNENITVRVAIFG